MYSLLLGTMTFFILLDDHSESHSNNVIFYSMFRQKLTFSRDHYSGADNSNNSSNPDTSMKFGKKHPQVILFQNQS